MYSIITMPENYLNILTDPAAGTGSEFMSRAVNFVEFTEPLFTGRDRCPWPAEGGQFVGGNFLSRKMHSAGFFQDHTKVFYPLQCFF